MAHAALHFAAGMLVGTAIAAPRLRRAWRARRELAPAFARWLAWSWGGGTFAIVPSLLRYGGIPDWICGGWWMNVFLLHPLINRCLPPATLAGTAAFLGLFAAQYALMLAALARIRRR